MPGKIIVDDIDSVAITSNCAIPPGEDPAIDCLILDRLLRMAQHYRHEGKQKQAMDIYWSILEDHADTMQSHIARLSLIDIAQTYDFEGARHMARTMYDRLLKT